MRFASTKVETETKRDDSVELFRFFVLGCFFMGEGNMRKIIVIFFLFFINACGQTPEVLMVQGGKLESCPSKTIEQMVDGFMGFPSWESLVAEDGNNYVNISGDITYAGKPIKALLQFKVNKDETFEYNALEYNGVVQNNLESMNLLTTMCEEGTGSSSEESSSLEEPDSSSALAVIDVLLDYKEFVKSGKKLEVKGFITTLGGDLTVLMEDRFNPTTLLWLNVDGLERDVRKKIIKDGDDGFSAIVIGKAEDVVFQKGMILTKIKY